MTKSNPESAAKRAKFADVSDPNSHFQNIPVRESCALIGRAVRERGALIGPPSRRSKTPRALDREERSKTEQLIEHSKDKTVKVTVVSTSLAKSCTGNETAATATSVRVAFCAIYSRLSSARQLAICLTLSEAIFIGHIG